MYKHEIPVISDLISLDPGRRRNVIQTKSKVFNYRRLFRKAGIRRISMQAHTAAHLMLTEYIKIIISRLLAIADHRKRKTIIMADLMYALK